eukprot:tig00020556_g11061.t1
MSASEQEQPEQPPPHPEAQPAQHHVSNVRAPTERRWALQSTSGERPPPVGGHAVAAVGSKLYVFGGANRDGRTFNALYELDTDSWTWRELKAVGTRPPPRTGHTLVAHGASLLLFGGQDPLQTQVYNDMHIFDLEKLAWRRVSAQGAIPDPRNSHGAAVLGGKMVVFGGANDDGPLDDVCVFDIATSTWLRDAPAGKGPAPREMFACAPLSASRLLVHGGRLESGAPLADLFVLDLEAMRWVPLGSSPFQRCAHVLAPAGDGTLVACGGTDCRQVLGDTWILNSARMEWTELKRGPGKQGKFVARFAHGGAGLADGRVVVVGGIDFEADSNDVQVLS